MSSNTDQISYDPESGLWIQPAPPSTKENWMGWPVAAVWAEVRARLGSDAVTLDNLIETLKGMGISERYWDWMIESIEHLATVEMSEPEEEIIYTEVPQSAAAE